MKWICVYMLNAFIKGGGTGKDRPWSTFLQLKHKLKVLGAEENKMDNYM